MSRKRWACEAGADKTLPWFRLCESLQKSCSSSPVPPPHSLRQTRLSTEEGGRTAFWVPESRKESEPRFWPYIARFKASWQSTGAQPRRRRVLVQVQTSPTRIRFSSSLAHVRDHRWCFERESGQRRRRRRGRKCLCLLLPLSLSPLERGGQGEGGGLG